MSRKRAASPTSDSTGTTSDGARPRIDRVVIDVGGQLFTTSVGTLTASSSYFQRVFSERWASDDAQCFLDRDPQPFAVLLSYMRTGDLDLDVADQRMARRVLLEAEFLGVDSLLEQVKARAQRNLDAAWKGSDAEASAVFDQEHGGLVPALRAGVLPARYFAPPAPPPAPPPQPTRKVVQLLPAPPGCHVKIWYQDETSGEEREKLAPVHCLALVDHPKELSAGREGGSQLDALVSDPHQYGHVLASEAYEATLKIELQFDGAAKDQILALPSDCNLDAEFWKDAKDHSKGTFSRTVRLLHFTHDEDGDPSIVPVDLTKGMNGDVTFQNVTEWSNFKCLKQ